MVRGMPNGVFSASSCSLFAESAMFAGSPARRVINVLIRLPWINSSDLSKSYVDGKAAIGSVPWTIKPAMSSTDI